MRHKNKVIQGSQGAGKTYSILQRWLLMAVKSKKKQHCTIVTDTFPALRAGALKDFQQICENEGIAFSGTKHPAIYRVGKWTFEFFSVDKEIKGRGGRRDRLFINEANRMPWKIARALIVRTHVERIFDFNPTEKFWAHTQFVDIGDCDFIKLTYKDNEYLPQAEVDDIEKHAPWGAVPDENYWRVFGLGELGFVEGLIFPKWEKYDELPKGVKLRSAMGVDFGFDDPMTNVIVHYDRKNNALYWREVFYASEASYDDFVATTKGDREYKKQPLICDSAQKREVMDLRKRGLMAMSCDKSGGLSASIRRIKKCKLYIHKDSKMLISEIEKYLWQEKNGVFIDYPAQGQSDHAIDPSRYASTYLLNVA